MKKRVLLVDDEETIRRLLKSVLELEEKFDVITAGSAAEGVQLLQRDSFDVVVTDLRMETSLAGYDLAKAAARLMPRPVTIILTAFPVPASEWKRAGADALMTKGSGSLKLAERIDELLSSQHLPPSKSAQPIDARKC